MDGRSGERRSPDPAPEDDRAKARAKEIRREHPEADDPDAAAEQLLEESDARTSEDPAPRDLDAEGVERRTSEDATPPPGSD